MDDLTEPWLELPVIVGAYTDQERMDLTLRGIPPVVAWDDERADHPNACRCPSCGRGQAITNAADGTRYCRWSDCANDYAANRRLVPLSDTPHEEGADR